MRSALGILIDAEALFVAETEVILPAGVALVGHSLEETRGFGGIFRDAEAFVVKLAEGEFGGEMALFGGLLEAARGGGGIL